jgi:hypothetical protein
LIGSLGIVEVGIGTGIMGGMELPKPEPVLPPPEEPPPSVAQLLVVAWVVLEKLVSVESPFLPFTWKV